MTTVALALRLRHFLYRLRETQFNATFRQVQKNVWSATGQYNPPPGIDMVRFPLLELVVVCLGIVQV